MEKGFWNVQPVFLLFFANVSTEVFPLEQSLFIDSFHMNFTGRRLFYELVKTADFNLSAKCFFFPESVFFSIRTLLKDFFGTPWPLSLFHALSLVS